MKSIVVRSFGSADVLEIVDVPEGDPGPGQVRVGVRATAVSWIDISARSGRLTASGLLAPAAEIGLGWDVAGVATAIGPDVTRFSIGDEVVGLRELLFAPGAYAESVVLDASALAPAPASVTLTEAATLPLNGLTAIQALDLADLSDGQTLLVTGAAGGVGGFLLQLASARGIDTIAVGRRTDGEFLEAGGAAHVLTDSQALGAAARRLVPGGVDAVIDTANLGIAAHDTLRSCGTFVALVRPFAPPPIRGTRVVVQEVWADGTRLAELVGMVDAQQLSLRVAQILSLAQAAHAHKLAETGSIRGRIVLQP
ncbi:MAG: NADP-dependent oxidoreductase [Jatrophihabitans sp.]